MKDKRKVKSVTRKIRLTREEAGRWQALAKMYAKGNLSLWARYALFAAHAKKLK